MGILIWSSERNYSEGDTEQESLDNEGDKFRKTFIYVAFVSKVQSEELC